MKVRKNKVNEVLERACNIKVYTLDNQFQGREIPNDKQIECPDGQHLMPFEYLIRQHRLFPRSELFQKGENKYWLRMHGNHWYEFELSA